MWMIIYGEMSNFDLIMVDKTGGDNTLLDPCNDRVVKSVPKPPRFPLQKNDLFKLKGISITDALIV